MTLQVVNTKFIPPPIRSRYIIRQRLFDRINKIFSDDFQVVLISAPAGFGKTYLAATWISQANRLSSWFAIDKDDNDPLLFWSHFLYSIQATHEDFGRNLAALLDTLIIPDFEKSAGSQHGVSIKKEFLSRLINEMNELEETFLIFIDDVHNLSNPEIFKDLSYLFEYLPRNLKLVFLTRQDPILPVGRLRAKNQLVEIRTADLQCTQEEVESFLSEVMCLDLQVSDSIELARKTDGWIVGLQIAALSLQSSDDPETFIKSFTGSHRHILDYMNQEVLQSESQEVRNFLFQTSILERFNLDLCRHLVTHENTTCDCGRILSQIEQKNLFLIPLDSEHIWFRYHSLFSDLLRNTLKFSQPDQYRELHYKASRWFEENGLIAEALDYILKNEDMQTTADIIEKHAFRYLMQGQSNIVLKWMGKLPIEVIYARPRLCLDTAWAHLFSRQLFLAERMIEYLESSPEFQQTPAIRREMIATRSFLNSWRGNSKAVIGPLQEIVNENEAGSGIVLALCKLMLAMALVDVGRTEEAYKYYQCSLKMDDNQSNAGLRLIHYRFLHDLAIAYRNRGQLQEAHAILVQALQVTDETIRKIPAFLPLQSGLAKVHMAQGRLKEAEALFRLGIQDSVEIENTASFDCRINLARLLLVKGAEDEADQLLQKSAWREREDDTSVILNFQILYALIHLARKELTQVAQWIMQRGLENEEIQLGEETSRISRYRSEFEWINAGRCLIGLGRYDTARKFFASLLEKVQETGNVEHIIDTLLLQAVLLSDQKEPSEAVEKMWQALDMGQQTGLVFPFLEKWELIEDLLAKKEISSYFGEFIDSTRKQYLAFRTSKNEKPIRTVRQKKPDEKSVLLETISRRERDILSLLAKGYTDKEIASKLSVALSTVKTHNHNLYTKLNVSGRMQCIEVARIHGLLEENR